jgi:DNA-binding PadR family transcriptional regulator
MSPRQSAPLTLEHVLLALLDHSPMHGYELYHALSQKQGISKIWNITQSMLYVMLDKLEERQLLASSTVQSDAYPPRKIYHITEKGRQALDQWMKTPVQRARQMRQEFLAKLIIARGYGPSEALALIHAQQKACQSWLEQLTIGFPPKDAEHMDTWLVDTYRIHRLKALMKWLDVCEGEFAGEQSTV